jgi:hypothetical protein
MDLREALRLIVDESFNAGALISCVPGRLGFYHDHEYATEQYVLWRQTQ